MFTWLAENPRPALLILAAIGLLVVAVTVYLVRQAIRSARRLEEEEKPVPDEAVTVDLTRSWRLRSAFEEGLAKLRRMVFGRDYRYQVPWVMVLGKVGSRPGDLFANAGLTLPAGPPSAEAIESDRSCSWWMLDRGVLLDLGSEYVLRADGQTWDAKGWQTFLHLLQHYRPERPSDGVVLTLHARDLVEALYNPDRRSALERQAGLLAERLEEAQRELGLRLPVWLLVTGCENLRGFEAFREALGGQMQESPLGWSSPYDPAISFLPEWVDEAVAGIASGLRRAQMQIYARLPTRETADAVFQIPEEVASLADPLRLALGRIFRGSTYVESPFLRGIYLTGSTPAEIAGDVYGHARSWFLRDLLESRVLSGSSLATPVGRTHLSRNRRVRQVRIAVVLLFVLLAVGTTWSYQQLYSRHWELRALFQKMDRNLDWVRRTGAADEEVNRERAADLLRDMSQVNSERFSSIFLPSSLLSSFNDRARQAVRREFDEVVFPALRSGIEERARRLSEGPSNACIRRGAAFGIAETSRGEERVGERDETPDPVPVDRMGDLHVLACHLEDLMALRRHILLYNDLPRTQGLEAFVEVAEYSLGFPLSPGEVTETSLYVEALAVEPSNHLVNLAPFQASLTATTATLYSRLYHRLYWENPLRDVLGRLDAELEKTALEDRRGARSSTERLEVLRRSIDDARLVRRHEVSWAFASEFDLGPTFDQVLTTTARLELPDPVSDAAAAAARNGGILEDRSRVFAEGLRGQMYNQGERGFVELQRYLLRVGSPYTGPFLERTTSAPILPRPSLAASLGTLDDQLQAWADGFPEIPAGRKLVTTNPGGMRLLWQPGVLREAEELVAPYENFRDTTLALFPDGLQSSVDEAARQQLAARLQDTLARAQRWRSTTGEGGPAFLRFDELSAEVEAYAAAAPRLREVLASYERLGLSSDASDLSGLLHAQADRLLREADRILEAGQPYQPGDPTFAAWQGAGAAGPAIFAAFGVSDETGLTGYLEAQRKFVQRVADQLVRPVLQSLPSTGGGLVTAPVRDRWESILSDLAAYEAQKPGNNLAQLESFIAAAMPATVPGDCPPGEPAVGGDFFVARRGDLRRDLSVRCDQKAAEGYRQIADLFNRRLAGRFPFTASLTGARLPAADPEAIRAFYDVFDRWAMAVESLLASGRTSRSAQVNVGLFLERMHDLRPLLGTFLATDVPGAVPALDFEAQLRVHRAREPGGELGGNEIIEWGLDVGEAHFTNRDPEIKGRWVFRDPVRVSLRWAKDGPRVPDSADPPPGAVVRDRTVSFTNQDPWALISFLRSHAASREDFVPFYDADPHTLRLGVRTLPAAGGLDPQEVKVFLRITLVHPDTKEALTMPLILPNEAPPLPLRTAMEGTSQAGLGGAAGRRGGAP